MQEMQHTWRETSFRSVYPIVARKNGRIHIKVQRPGIFAGRGAVRKKKKRREADSGVSLDVVLDASGGQITGRLHEQYAAAVEDRETDDVHVRRRGQIRCKGCAVDAGDGQVGKATLFSTLGRRDAG